jgi:hypothetical protein
MFSCGGRADGGMWASRNGVSVLTFTGGAVTNSQLFIFAGGAGPLSLEPTNVSGCYLRKYSRPGRLQRS